MRPHNDNKVHLDLLDFQQLPALYPQKLSLNTLTNHKFWHINTFSLTLSVYQYSIGFKHFYLSCLFLQKSFINDIIANAHNQARKRSHHENVVSNRLNFWFLQMSKKYQLRLQRFNLLSCFPPPDSRSVLDARLFSPQWKPWVPACSLGRILQQHCCCVASGQAFTN